MLEVVFHDKFLPLNENGSKLKEQIGLIVRNPHRLPLTYLDWRAVHIDIKDVIWREIQVKMMLLLRMNYITNILSCLYMMATFCLFFCRIL